MRIALVLILSCVSAIAGPINFAQKSYTQTKGLVGWWQFEEDSGTNLLDSSASGKTGSIVSLSGTGNAYRANGAYGNGLKLLVNGYATIGTSSDYSYTAGTSFSISLWVTNVSSAGYQFIISKEFGGAGYVLAFDNTHRIYLSNNSGYYASSNAVAATSWTHVVGVWSWTGSTYSLKLYINGTLDTGGAGVASAALSSNNKTIEIGRKSDVSAYLNGAVSDVRIYNYALSASDVLYLYQTPRASSVYYVFPSFNNTGETLRMFKSSNGWGFREVPVSYTPSFGTVRDTSMWYSNQTYYIAHTTGGVGGSTNFAIASSLSMFGPYTTIALVNCTNVQNCATVWGVTPFVDPADGSFHILTSISTNSGNGPFAPYRIEPTDSTFTNWNNPTLITGVAAGAYTNTIGEFILRKGSTYYLWTKDENAGAGGKYQIVFSSSSPFSGYTTNKIGDWAGWGSNVYEGVYPVLFGDSEWRAFQDRFSNSTGEYWSKSDDDWTTWTTPLLIPTDGIIRNGILWKRTAF